MVIAAKTDKLAEIAIETDNDDARQNATLKVASKFGINPNQYNSEEKLHNKALTAQDEDLDKGFTFYDTIANYQVEQATVDETRAKVHAIDREIGRWFLQWLKDNPEEQDVPKSSSRENLYYFKQAKEQEEKMKRRSLINKIIDKGLWRQLPNFNYRFVNASQKDRTGEYFFRASGLKTANLEAIAHSGDAPKKENKLKVVSPPNPTVVGGRRKSKKTKKSKKSKQRRVRTQKRR